MAKTTAQEQLDQLVRMKKERRSAPLPRPQPGPADRPEGKAVNSIEPVRRTRPRSRHPERRTLALPVRTEDLRKLMLSLRQYRDFKSKRELADWVMTLLLELPGKAHALPAEGLAELFQRMREWMRSRGLSQ